MRIETDKLIIQPLLPGELRLYILPGGELERHLGLLSGNREVPENVKKVITEKILPVLDNPDCNIHFHTFWTIISKKHNTMVADICFKGDPNIHNEVEIGYGTYTGYQGNGVMTDAVKEIIKWAFAQGITAVVAETNPANIASQKVLQKNNFIKTSECADNIMWRCEKSWND